MWQNIVIVLILAVVVALVARHLHRKLTDKSPCCGDCGGCQGCASTGLKPYSEIVGKAKPQGGPAKGAGCGCTH